MKKKDFKFYADECIEQDFIDHLRKDHNIDIKSAFKEGLKGKPDITILKRANETQRFLLTYNRKHFYTEDLFPFKDLFGIICLTFPKTEYPCKHLQRLAFHKKESLIGKKFLVSYDNITVRYQAEDGKIEQKILSMENCFLCELEESRRA